MDEANDDITPSTPELKQFVVSVPQFLEKPAFVNDTTTSDILSSFPSDTAIYTNVVDVISYVCSVNQYVYNSLVEINRSTDKTQNWISFSEPILGAYTSPGDSRHKQWQLDSNAVREGEHWDFHLLISDFVENEVADLRPALELFYNVDFTKGYMVFSPSDFDRIRFPEKRFGSNVKCEIEFTRSTDKVVNKCHLSGFTTKAHSSNINYVGNITLTAEQSGSNIINYSGIADFPYIWFDSPENKGYSLNFAGSADASLNVAAFFAGLTKNSDESVSMRKLIVDNSAGTFLSNIYALWLQNVENAADLPQEFDAFANPGFFIERDYKGCGKSSNNDVVAVTTRAQALIDQQSLVSPYQNSIYQVEWSK
ncbi:MAG: hypothetical protein J6Y24_16960 [Bacteroidales bacterium]|nr:hypothetical protein [Bacteroidales bacterium]